jgi:hypothetical protein
MKEILTVSQLNNNMGLKNGFLRPTRAGMAVAESLALI